MTSEVVLMNRSAVALAADSAVTVTHWHARGAETRFYKGANKIFNLAYGRPVGLMTYSSATLLGVPLEVVVKAYREQLSESFKDLTGHAMGFFDYLPSELRLFPVAHQEAHFKAQVQHLALTLLVRLTTSEDVKNEPDQQKRKALVEQQWQNVKQLISDAKLLGNATNEDIKRAANQFRKEIAKALSTDEYFIHLNLGIEWDELADVAITGLYKKEITILDKTGIVIAGYGEEEFFPSCIVYESWGLVLGKCLFEEVKRKAVSHGHTSHIVPVAQSEMMQTFINGISPSGVGAIGSIFSRVLKEFEKEACGDDKNRAKLRDKAGDQFVERLLDNLFDNHTLPLRRVVGSLPIDELAGLAETLISIESLKERVTRPTESVSGPIDVAVISKGDGFIWIRSKHYFDPELNPRFFATRGLKGGMHDKDSGRKARRIKQPPGAG